MKDIWQDQQLHAKQEDQQARTCELDEEGRCITCSDEAIAVTIVQVDPEHGRALVEVKQSREEIDITLIEPVIPGDIVLVHAGIAIGKYDSGT